MDPLGETAAPRGRSFGRYLLLEPIDRGGMADVYRAVTHGPGGFQRQFVIKRIRKEKAASKDFVEMFVNEARISALLDHPNIVQVYDFGQVDGDYFLAMEYLRGRNLLAVGRRLRSAGRPVPADLARTSGARSRAGCTTRTGWSAGRASRSASSTATSARRTSCCSDGGREAARLRDRARDDEAREA